MLQLKRKYLTARSLASALVTECTSPLASRLKMADHIVISGTPRGGTTWLAQVLLKVGHYCLIWEPDTPSKIGAFTDAHIPWRIYVPPGGSFAPLEAHLKCVLTGRRIRANRHPKYDAVSDALFPRKLLVKFCRANRFLPWMVDAFPLRPPILLVRHPCAVISSMLRFGQWDRINKDEMFDFLRGPNAEFYGQYEALLDRVQFPEEIFAVNWCLDNVIPLFDRRNNKKWITVSYEKLVRDGHSELERICSRLNLMLPSNTSSLLCQPSETTRSGSPILYGGNQLSGWRKNLSTRQVARILDVVNAFGLGHIFTEAVEPEYGALYAAPV